MQINADGRETTNDRGGTMKDRKLCLLCRKPIGENATKFCGTYHFALYVSSKKNWNKIYWRNRLPKTSTFFQLAEAKEKKLQETLENQVTPGETPVGRSERSAILEKRGIVPS